MKAITYLTLFLFTCSSLLAQKKTIEFTTEKKDGILSIYGSNNLNEDLEITLNIKGIKMLKGYTKPITKLVKANSKELFIDLTYKYDIYDYKLSYTYKKPQTEVQKAIASYNKEDYMLEDLSKIDEGIVVFVDDGCGTCRLVTNYLVGNKIDFKVIDLANNQANQKFMWKTIKDKGASMKVKLPVIVVNGDISHSHEDIKAFLESLE